MNRVITVARRVVQRHTRLVMFLAALIVVVGGTESALALSSQAPSQEADPGAAQLRVFQRAQTGADALPPSFSAALQAGFASQAPNVADSREVTANDGQAAYLVPAQSGGICFINTNEAMCVPAAHSAGAAAVDLCSPALPIGQMEIEWLMPDGATNIWLGMSDGTTRTFASGSNLYITRLPLNGQSPVPSTINWNSSGQHYSVKTPLPPGAQDESCAHPPATASAAIARHSRHKLNQLVTKKG